MISVARAGLDTGKRFSVGCRVLRGFLACVSSAIAARPDRARALSRGRNLGLSPLLGRSAVATGLPKGVKGMALALRAALTWRTTRVLLLATSTLNFRVAKRCRDMSRGAHSRPRRPATANQANRPTPEKPELCSFPSFRGSSTQTELCYYERRRAGRDSVKRGGRPGPKTWPGRRRGARPYESRPTPPSQQDRSNRNYTKRLAPRRDHAPDLLQRLVDDAARGSSSGLLPHALQASLRVPREHRPPRRDAGVSQGRSNGVIAT